MHYANLELLYYICGSLCLSHLNSLKNGSMMTQKTLFTFAAHMHMSMFY